MVEMWKLDHNKYEDFLRYDAYLAAGFPIATGVIEGAWRTHIKVFAHERL